MKTQPRLPENSSASSNRSCRICEFLNSPPCSIILWVLLTITVVALTIALISLSIFGENKEGVQNAKRTGKCEEQQPVQNNNSLQQNNNSLYRTPPPHDEDYHRTLVERINSVQNTWKAKYNKDAQKHDDIELPLRPWKKISEAYTLAYDLRMINDSIKHIQLLQQALDDVPKSFDARLKWPLCSSIHTLYNQGGCGSCWATTAATVISDRICIHSNYTQQPSISVEHLLACTPPLDGCHGSESPVNAYVYWRDYGVVTGGLYESHEGCQPYSFSPVCGAPCSSFHYAHTTSPTCTTECRKGYTGNYSSDKHYANEAYVIPVDSFWLQNVAELVPESVSQHESFKNLRKISQMETLEVTLLLKRELMMYGPTGLCFFAFEDLQHYSSGVYKPIPGMKPLYGHCVRVIGWGETSEGLPYWIAVNSWGRNWGLNGLFWIDMSLIERVTANGLPSFSSSTSFS